MPTIVWKPGKIVNRLEKLLTALQVTLYRLSAGSVAGTFAGVPVLLLTTVGNKTGKRRTKPLLYMMDGEQFVLVASHGGAPTHPGWWRNLLYNPRAEIQVGSKRLQVEAREAAAEERQRLWPRLVALYPGFENYQQHTTRAIPVVILQRTSLG
jgi:deazaflavin-dependent oxidoreductase (nitroreductase family)